MFIHINFRKTTVEAPSEQQRGHTAGSPRKRRRYCGVQEVGEWAMDKTAFPKEKGRIDAKDERNATPALALDSRERGPEPDTASRE